jgi:hypothetical protein
MAASESEVRLQLAREREQLAASVDELRRLADLNAAVRARLPLVLAGTFAAAFVLSGGIGATMRLIFRHGREGHVVWRSGRYTLVRH